MIEEFPELSGLRHRAYPRTITLGLVRETEERVSDV